MLVSQARRGLFEKFKNPESTEESRSKCIPGRQGSSHQTVSPNTGDGKLYSKKPYLWSGVMFLRNSKTQNQKFGVLWLWNRVPGHWPSQGAKLWPFKGAKTGVFGFSRGVTYSEYLSWHVANTISSLTAIQIINRCPPPVLGHHPFLVIIYSRKCKDRLS